MISLKLEDLLDNPRLTKRLTRKALFLITFTVVLVFIVFHLDVIGMLAGRILGLFGSFFAGIAVAFVLNVLVRLFEDRIFGALTRSGNKIWGRCKRVVCVTLSIVVIVLFLLGIIFYVVPELNSSTRILADYININGPVFIAQATEWANRMLVELDIRPEQVSSLKIDWPTVISQATQFTSGFMGSLVSVTMNIASGVVAFAMSLIFGFYMIFSKEKLIRNLKRVLYAFLPGKVAHKLIYIGSLSNRIFSGFVTGQLTEALIIGCLCYIGMSVIRLPYSLLISVVVSLTSLVPILGAYLGGGIGVFILLIIEPVYALWFLIFLIALQQFESNLIYPRVVGTSIGLPGLWMLLAILVCGDLFGIAGIILGVPACSVLYTLMREETGYRLRRKRITTRQAEENTAWPPEEIPDPAPVPEEGTDS